MLDTSRPFTRSDALAAGISRARLAGPRFRRVFRTVYIASHVPPSDDERQIAALLLHPEGAWLSHTTAARRYGVAVPDDSIVHVSVHRAEDRRWQPDLKPHVAPPTAQSRQVGGLTVSEPIRMFVELASCLDLVDLVAAGDSMVKTLRLTPGQLVDALQHCPDYWSGAARRAAAFVRAEVDSPMETRTRMLLVLAGFPEPEVNVKLRDETGHVFMRFDLGYPGLRVAIEYDGRQHAERGQWQDDLVRRETADDLGWRIIKVTSPGIYSEPARTLARVAHAMRRAGYALPPMGDAWRPFFPERRRTA